MNTIAKETLENINSMSAVEIFKNSRLLQVCAILLVAQLVLAALLGITQKKADFNTGQALFALKEADINSLTIDNRDETVELTKRNDSWVLDGNDSLRADPGRLNTLLDSLVSLKVGLPVASSPSAREQLEVADDNYQRKLVINDDAANTFLLGTSPGLRKAHLRPDGSDEIYSAALPVSSLPASIDTWLDKSLLSLKDISRLTTDSITFESTGAGDEKSWKILDSTDQSKSIETEKLTALIGALESLTVTGLSEVSTASTGDRNGSRETNSDSDDKDSDASNESDQETKFLEFSVISEGNELKLTLEKNDNNTLITRSDIDQVFSASTSVFEQIAEPILKADWFVDGDVEQVKDENYKE